MLEYNRKLKKRSQELRNKMTDPEIILWSKLKGKQIKNAQFYRQKPIGNYIVDFYCAKYKIIIELDGSQHYTDEGLEYDSERDTYLKFMGLKVLRFTNIQIMNELNSVLTVIFNEMNENKRK